MLMYPQIDPVAFHLGPLSVHWYGLMYLMGFFAGWAVLSTRLRRADFTPDQLADILFYSALGIIIGGRVGYMLFYAWPDLLYNPLSVFQIWKGGMSFHGGLLGVLIALSIYSHRIGKSLVEITDFIAPAVPIGLGLGRLGNFINGELWGKTTNVPWGVIFPNAGSLPRHPSQLYEFLLEGVLLFIILWLFSQKPKPRWAVSGVFLVFYGLFRFVIELFREPDAQIGYLAFGWVTEGQLLSLPMMVVGMLMLFWGYRRKICSNI